MKVDNSSHNIPHKIDNYSHVFSLRKIEASRQFPWHFAPFLHFLLYKDRKSFWFHEYSNVLPFRVCLYFVPFCCHRIPFVYPLFFLQTLFSISLPALHYINYSNLPHEAATRTRSSGFLDPKTHRESCMSISPSGLISQCIISSARILFLTHWSRLQQPFPTS